MSCQARSPICCQPGISSSTSKPISSLAAIKDTLWAPLREELARAQDREIEHFKRLLGGPANTEALLAFAEGRQADFSSLPPGW